MWIWMALFLGCGRADPPSADQAEEAPVAAKPKARASASLDCQGGDAACDEADARLRAINIVLRRDCEMSGGVDPDACKAEQARLREERSMILRRFGAGTRATTDGGMGGGGDGGEGMEIDIDDE